MALSTATQRLTAHIRWLIRRDMPAVCQIEQDSYQGGWTEENFATAMRERQANGMVAEVGSEVAGYVIYQVHDYGIELVNITVATRFRRRGVGRQILANFLSKLSRAKCSRLCIDVRETNLPAQLFFKACGFKAECVLHSHFDDTDEDAFRMIYRHDPKEVV